MANKNYQIAKFYSLMFELQKTLNSEILPLAVHIGTQAGDPRLFQSLEVLATGIAEHLKNHELSITESKI